MKSSYSQNNTYIACPQHWKWSYIEKLRVPDQSSALYFGSAVDDAIMANLEGDSNYLDIFYSRWTTAKGYGNNPDIPLFDNLTVGFSPGDFDTDLLKPEDYIDMDAWVKTLKLTSLGTSCIEVFNQIKRNMRNPMKRPSKNQLLYFNRCCWVSMKRKGEILIESFIKDFKPKIKKVLAVQKPARIYDPANGDTIYGFIDFVAEIEGHAKPVIFDLKTASKPYAQSKIDLTEQLTLYYAMAGEEFNTDLVGYVVLSKAINKKEKHTCITCGNIRSGKHKTCNALDKDKKRCGGSWDLSVEIDPQVQVLVQQKTKEQKESLLKDYSNIMLAMRTGIVYRNHDKCNNWYGGQCPYYNACHNNDTSGLIKK